MIEAVVGVALRAILASVLLGGVLAALVLLATRTLSLTAATRHALWTTALIATAVMPLAGVGVSVWKGAPAQPARPPHAVRGPQSELAISIRPTHDAAVLAPSPRSQPQTTRIQASPRSDGVEPVASSAQTTSFADWLRLDERLAFAAWTPRVSRALALGMVAVWALGALAGLIGLAASVARVRGLKRRSSPLDSMLADELPWLTEAGPGREIYLRLSYETETPVAIGFRRPVILVPTELATADGLGAIEPLILHEHAHLRRNDDWTNLLQRAIERVFWFNPIVWLVGCRIALEREIASDDAVVEKTGEPHAYATSLWKLAREMRMPEHAVVAPGALLTRKQITVRIEQLLDKKRARLHRSPMAALGVALAGMLSIAFVATSAPGVELPAEAAPANAATAFTAATAPAHVAQTAHGRIATALGTQPAKHRSAGATSIAAVASRTAAAERALQAAKTNAAGASDSQSKALQVQLRALREQLAAAKKTAAAAHATTIRVVARVPQDTSPAMPREMPQTLRELPAMPAAAVPPLAPMPVVAPTAPVISPPSVARLQALAAAASARARARDLSHTSYEAQIERTIAAAMATIPHEVATEMNVLNLRHSKLDGVKLTREMVASCAACSFRNADARGLDLHDLKLNADNFTGADMRGANLAGAKLSGVSLAGANLANADLRGAQLSAVELRGTNFDGAQLDGIRLTGVSIRHASMRGTALRSVVANCTGCEFAGVDLHGQDLHGLTLTGIDLSHSDLHDANLSGVRFFSVDLSRANLSGADLTNAHFETCDLDGADLRGARTAGMTTHPSGYDG